MKKGNGIVSTWNGIGIELEWDRISFNANDRIDMKWGSIEIEWIVSI